MVHLEAAQEQDMCKNEQKRGKGGPKQTIDQGHTHQYQYLPKEDAEEVREVREVDSQLLG